MIDNDITTSMRLIGTCRCLSSDTTAGDLDRKRTLSSLPPLSLVTFLWISNIIQHVWTR